MQDTIMEPFKVLNELNVVKKNSFTLLYFVNMFLYLLRYKILYLEDFI